MVFWPYTAYQKSKKSQKIAIFQVKFGRGKQTNLKLQLQNFEKTDKILFF